MLIQKQVFHCHEQVEGARPLRVAEGIGIVRKAGRIVQIHVAKNVIESLPLGSLDPLLLENKSCRIRFVNPVFCSSPPPTT